jgi:hypothetical protein
MFTKTFVEKSPVRGKTSDDLEFLKAEKIKSFWELLSYEEIYKEKKSIRARVTAIRNSAKLLLEEVLNLNQSIALDQGFFHDVEEVLERKFKKKGKKNWGFHVGLAWVDFWICFRSSLEVFLVQVVVNQTSFKVKIKVFSSQSSEIISQKFPEDSGFQEILKDSSQVLRRFFEVYLGLVNLKFSKNNWKIKEISMKGKNSYEWFDQSCIVGEFSGNVENEKFSVKIFENLSVSLYMIQLFHKGKTFDFLSSDYQDQFDFLFSLQFTSLSFQSTTFFKSLEFSFFISALLKSLD